MTPYNQTTVNRPLSSLSDSELVIQAQFELPYETRAFQELVKRYQDKVFAKVRSMLNNEEDAKDLTQDIFIKIYNNLPKFRMKASFSTWLYIISVNTTLNYIEKQKRKPTWWLTSDYETEFAEKEETEILYIMGKGVEADDVGACIEDTLEKLPDSSKEIIEYRFLEEMDYQEIAAKMKLKLSAMKMRLKRAREDFRQEFELNCMGE